MFSEFLKLVILVFGNVYDINGYPENIRKYDLPKLSACLDMLSEEIKGPLICGEGEYDDPINFFNTKMVAPYDLGISYAVNDWIWQHFGKARGFTGNMIELFLSLATEDKEWGASNNRELKTTYYHRITFFPEVIEAVEAEIDRIELEIQKTYEIVNAVLEKEQRWPSQR